MLYAGIAGVLQSLMEPQVSQFDRRCEGVFALDVAARRQVQFQDAGTDAVAHAERGQCESFDNAA